MAAWLPTRPTGNAHAQLYADFRAPGNLPARRAAARGPIAGAVSPAGRFAASSSQSPVTITQIPK
ncbi:hypothetical protein C7S16_1774 [Burkholderia thailandensis]|uniref:Uncharacterized protein n=1 Tax=Burkholderia thailandensis TaxID=57975 RepID=A0AAW9CWG6_BURTH|nr:hypothetical protein [Burkholderia thailandensis]MDW9254011.1 hypothetical protein [Burkholderia thailandensis]